ncbi:MAG: hypothetical protein PHR26_03905, partial [Candidatus ainarchaeum sp.]|nr:hypothetical protein [Candidatus ainarchaeum sp.]
SNTSLSVGYILKDILHLADNTREVKYIIKNREIYIDKKKVKDHRFPVGLYDIFEIPKLNKFYRIYYKLNGSLSLKEITKEEATFKICKIKSKKILGKEKVQLTTNDGRTIITTNIAYKPKASIKLDLEENVIKEYFPLEKGREVLVIGGKHIGQIAKIESIKPSNMQRQMLIQLKESGIDFETTEKNIVVIN